MTICPLCEQGVIKQVKINATNEAVYLCDECEALWIESVTKNNALSFDDFMIKRKLKPLWSEISEIGNL